MQNALGIQSFAFDLNVAGHLDQLHIEASQPKRLWLHQANHAVNLLIAKKILGDLPEEEDFLYEGKCEAVYNQKFQFLDYYL